MGEGRLQTLSSAAALFILRPAAPERWFIMIDINRWTRNFLRLLKETFGDRIWFVGLQGSYGRGEATESSDIDLAVVLDGVQPADIRAYRDMLDRLPNRELACGFLSGKAELLRWDAADLFQFCHDTLPIVGSLDSLLARIDGAAVDRAVRTGVCNIYHACVHNMIYERSEDALRALYKSAAFVAQAIHFRETGAYIKRHRDLLGAAAPAEQAILRTVLELRSGGAVDFDAMSDALFAWAKGRICA